MTDLESLRPTLDAVLDTLIPVRDDGTPGAGGLGVGAHVIEKVGDDEPTAALVADGLAALDAAAREADAAGFAALEVSDRAALLERVAEARPGLLQSLVFHAYAGYYQHPRAIEAIGLPPRPPWPEGYEHSTAGDDASSDFDSLDRVRERGRLYREV